MRANEQQIIERLLDRGCKLFSEPRRELVTFTGEGGADTLRNDIEARPRAFVFACILDRQMTAERAWRIPLALQQRLGRFDFPSLENLSLAEIEKAMTEPDHLHRFSRQMATYLHSAIKRIRGSYNGDASGIWKDKPSSYAVVCRFLEFDGIGVKIATMAANILARGFKIPMRDHRAIDISPDPDVRRVFQRLALIPSDGSIDHLLYRARELSPEFPGLFDYSAFEIGRKWCRPRQPDSAACYMNDLCPSTNAVTIR